MHRARRIEALTAPLINAVLADAGIDAARVDEVILGNAAGGGGNPARLATLAAGLPVDVPAMTLDRQCSSGLDAIIAAARMIAAGEADVVIAGGAESPSTAPWRVAKPASLYRGAPEFFEQPAFAPESLGDPGMAEAAEIVAEARGLTRAAQDAYALESWRRASAAQARGVFGREIVSLSGDASDECIRERLTPVLLARAPAIVKPGGTVTAGNSCQNCDGAALALVVSEAVWRERKPPALRYLGGAAAGVHPRLLGEGPVAAVEKLMRRLDRLLGDVDAVELNEAFAAQALACITALRLHPQRVNADGGALAFGHPYGASGAVLVARLFTRMIRSRDAQLGLATLAAAGGLGAAALFERIS
jgi:acetyl-CoA C-acetyltransferase